MALTSKFFTLNYDVSSLQVFSVGIAGGSSGSRSYYGVSLAFSSLIYTVPASTTAKLYFQPTYFKSFYYSHSGYSSGVYPTSIVYISVAGDLGIPISIGNNTNLGNLTVLNFVTYDGAERRDYSTLGSNNPTTILGPKGASGVSILGTNNRYADFMVLGQNQPVYLYASYYHLLIASAYNTIGGNATFSGSYSFSFAMNIGISFLVVEESGT